MKPFKQEKDYLEQSEGICKLNIDPKYILYTKDNWEEVKAFCEPLSIEKSKMNTRNGRAVIDLPTGNETFTYGMILVRLGIKKVLILSPKEFRELFTVIDSKN